MLEVKDLHVSYGQSEVVHGVSFEAKDSEILAIMGRNGMGKTTLMKALMGLLPIKSGTIKMNGVDVGKMDSYKRVQNGIAYVPQGRLVFPNMSVTDNIRSGENGKFYYAMIRTVGFDNRESALSNLVSFRPLDRGEFTISTNHLGDNGGFNFETGTQVPGKDRRSDLYLYSNGNKTGLSSPSRLSAGLRKSSFSSNEQENLETIPIKTGDKIMLKTKYGDIDLTVVSLNGSYPEISAKIKYIFYPGSR